MNIGFIGAGNMGQSMIGNLLKAGHHVTAYARTPDRAAQLTAAIPQAVVARDFSEFAGVDAIITMVADDHALEEVIAGLAPHLSEDAIHISMETISPALSTKLWDAHKAAGRRYVAAPVIGRPEAAAAAKLVIMPAGDGATLDHLQPLFDVIGQKSFRMSDQPPAGHAVKLGVNFLIASAIESLGEAIALMRKSGIGAEPFVELITSTLFACPAYKIYGDLIAKEQYEPAGFRVPLGLKDIRLVLGAAEAAQAPMPFASVIRDHFLEALAQGQGHMDWSSVARVSARHAGLP